MGVKVNDQQLEPVDELSILTVRDNTVDMLLPDEGPAKRLSMGGADYPVPMVEAPPCRKARSAMPRSGSTGSLPWSRSARAARSGGCPTPE